MGSPTEAGSRKCFMLHQTVHIQYIRKVGGSQDGGYDSYRLLGRDVML